MMTLSACGGGNDKPEVREDAGAAERRAVEAALGRVTLNAIRQGMDIVGVKVENNRGLVTLYYGGETQDFVVCDNAQWPMAEGGTQTVNLGRNTSFVTPSDIGQVEIGREVRLDALTTLEVTAAGDDVVYQPSTHYVLSMMTEVVDPTIGVVGRQAERLEFDDRSRDNLASGHGCSATGTLNRSVMELTS